MLSDWRFDPQLERRPTNSSTPEATSTIPQRGETRATTTGNQGRNGTHTTNAESGKDQRERGERDGDDKPARTQTTEEQHDDQQGIVSAVPQVTAQTIVEFKM